jgi:ceramide synthetase
MPEATTPFQEASNLLIALGQTLSGADASGLSSNAQRLTTEGHLDVYVFLLFTIMQFLINWGVRMLMVEPIAANILLRQNTKKTVDKFGQSAMEALFYGGYTVIGVLLVPRQPWIWPSSNWWMGFAEGKHDLIRADLRCYYLLYGSRYLQGLISIFLEHKRKDFWEMFLHHTFTVLVVIISYIFGWNRVGAVVMVLLDPADVPLHVAKLCKYTAESRPNMDGKPNTTWQWGADRFFELFALVFFVMRLVMYPYVCWSSHFEAARYFTYNTAAWACVALLELLLVLQVYWFTLLVKAAINMWKKGGIEDIRSDLSDAEEDPKKK